MHRAEGIRNASNRLHKQLTHGKGALKRAVNAAGQTGQATQRAARGCLWRAKGSPVTLLQQLSVRS